MNRLTTLSLIALLTAAACGGDKVKPDGDSADAALSPEQREIKQAEEYRKRQAAFADSVLGSAKSVSEVAKNYGPNVQVGSVQMRDSLLKYVQASPQCFKNGREIDPYLAGTATFYIHMSVVGSDVVRVQTSQWTSQAGTVVDKCFNELTPKWKFPMGMAKQGQYLLQVQFK
ncbi:MAG TPA: hypothetical protein VGJ96_04120 [Gemmatimonadaceae bacterium]|jgi:hypothetical protein